MTACAFQHDRPEDLRENFDLTNGCQFADCYEGDFIEHDGRMYCPFHAPEGLGEGFGGGRFFRKWEGEWRRGISISEDDPPFSGEKDHWTYLRHAVRADYSLDVRQIDERFVANFEVAVSGDDGLHRAIHAYAGLLELESEPQRVTDLSGVRFPRDFVYYQLHWAHTAGEKKPTNPILLDKAIFEEDAIFRGFTRFPFPRVMSSPRR